MTRRVYKRKISRRAPRARISKKPSRIGAFFHGLFSMERNKVRLKKIFRFTFRATILLAIWGGVILAAVIAYYAYDLPDIKQIAQPGRRPAITLVADDGTIFKRYGDLYGKRVALRDVPETLVKAILAIEDRRFYSHFGIDMWGLARASYQNARAKRLVQGGSTITQQLAKNLFLTPQRTAKRKVQEMLLALWLERTYSKDQILTAYLNRVYLGAGAYGVDAAASVYFDKPVRDLTLLESAMLAGLLRAPSRYAPTNDPAATMRRAETVLTAMVDADYIALTDKQRALASVAVPPRKPGAGGDGQYFADWIADQVIAILEKEPQDIVVYTTIDLDLEREAERRLDAVLASPEAVAQNVSEAALVSMSYDGAVRAMVGGRDYAESQFNRATQAMRQPGSSFKPIVYLAALEAGLSPDDMIEDAPLKIGKWMPRNYDERYRGMITARQALIESVNTAAVRVMQKAGMENTISTARALGITSPLEHNLSLALGTNTVTPLEMTGVYAALAAGGRAVMPYGIKEIRSRKGKLLYRREAMTMPQTVNTQAVATLVDMMQDVVRYGTGRRAGLDRPVAGKTGTSSDYRDGWFLGFTGSTITGIWMGNDDNKPMKKVTGGGLPAQLWHDFMIYAEAGKPIKPLLEGILAPPVEETRQDGIGAFIRGLVN